MQARCWHVSSARRIAPSLRNNPTDGSSQSMSVAARPSSWVGFRWRIQQSKWKSYSRDIHDHSSMQMVVNDNEWLYGHNAPIVWGKTCVSISANQFSASLNQFHPFVFASTEKRIRPPNATQAPKSIWCAIQSCFILPVHGLEHKGLASWPGPCRKPYPLVIWHTSSYWILPITYLYLFIVGSPIKDGDFP